MDRISCVIVDDDTLSREALVHECQSLPYVDIVGSKRLGSLDTVMRMQKPTTGYGSLDSMRIAYLEGQRQYELTNHLGNVLVTVSDKVTPVDTLYSVPHIADYYEAVIINAQDYYPFGMVEPGRQYAILHDSSYHYGFNGKLHDDDIYGKDNSYDYGMRMYDPRLGRFMSIDPIAKKYPELTPYQFASNTPIQAVDLDGKEAMAATYLYNNQGALIGRTYTYLGNTRGGQGEYNPTADIYWTEIHQIAGGGTVEYYTGETRTVPGVTENTWNPNTSAFRGDQFGYNFVKQYSTDPAKATNPLTNSSQLAYGFYYQVPALNNPAVLRWEGTPTISWGTPITNFAPDHGNFLLQPPPVGSYDHGKTGVPEGGGYVPNTPINAILAPNAPANGNARNTATVLNGVYPPVNNANNGTNGNGNGNGNATVPPPPQPPPAAGQLDNTLPPPK